tara:strand:+ start:666 stop:1496 length:831 start_codon:yes stop_codon:yes gene_type:complete
MNRTLKRPMFRRGGSADGITSGLDRQNYNVGGEVERIRALYNQFAPRTQTQAMPGSVSSFLTNFGLNLLSAPPRGGLLSTAATAAKEPFNTFQSIRAQEALQDRALQQAIVGQAIESDEAKSIAEAQRKFDASQAALDRASDLEIAKIKDKSGYAAQTYEEQVEAMRGDLTDAAENRIISKYKGSRADDISRKTIDFIQAADAGQRSNLVEIDYVDVGKKGKVQYVPDVSNVQTGQIFYDAIQGQWKKRVSVGNGALDFVTLDPSAGYKPIDVDQD